MFITMSNFKSGFITLHNPIQSITSLDYELDNNIITTC